MREDSERDQNGYDPEQDVRNRILNQDQGAAVPDPVPNPVYDAPPDSPPPPQQQPEQQAITDPTPQSPSPPPQQDPNSPEALAEQNRIYGVGGTAFNPPSPTATFDPNTGGWNQPAPAPPPQAGGRPSGGNLTDPNFAAQYVAWAATQPGVNPSVKNDPGYWIGRFTSGAFGNDQNYALQRMLTPEGPPEGAGAPTQQGGTVARTTTQPQASAPVSFNLPAAPSYGQSAPQGLWNADQLAAIRQLIMQRLSADGQPVDQNDPSITAPLTAARDEATRSSDKERTALAENLYANGGLNTDAISQKIQQSGEKNAQGLSSLRATLITRELQSRRDELKSLLQMAVQSGDAESATQIQMQMAELDAQVKREGLGDDLAKYSAYLNTVGAQAVM